MPPACTVTINQINTFNPIHCLLSGGGDCSCPCVECARALRSFTQQKSKADLGGEGKGGLFCTLDLSRTPWLLAADGPL